jgi:hypothetical protein
MKKVYESFKQMKAECDGRLGKIASKEMHWGRIHAVVKFGSSENAAPNATQQYSSTGKESIDKIQKLYNRNVQTERKNRENNA